MGYNGKPIRCKTCYSVLHLKGDCPHNNEQTIHVEPVDHNSKSEDIVLFTGPEQNEMCLLTAESKNAAVLDSACTLTVAVINCINCFMGSLSDSKRQKVTRRQGKRVFRFGGEETKKSFERNRYTMSYRWKKCYYSN